MTNRVTLPSQDFQRMCKQVERDHEMRKLTVLLDRVKRQIAERDNPELRIEEPKPPVSAISANSRVVRLPGRLAPFER
jgi:hypothetical protein